MISEQNLANKLKFIYKEDKGSISVLIIGLFTIVLILSIGILNVSGSYIAKRQLIQIGEEAVQRASHSLDYFQYYLGDRSWEPTNRIPLDCQAASREVSRNIALSNLNGRSIQVSSFLCRDGLIRVGLHAEILPILQFPLFEVITGRNISINAEVESGTFLGQS